MGFPYMQIFKQWDPLTGNLPNCYPDQFEEIARQARKILKNRTWEEILKAQIVLDKAYRNSYQHDPFEEGQKIDFVTWQKDLRRISDYLKKQQFKSNKFAWHEYIASVALAAIGSVFLFESGEDSHRKMFKQSKRVYERQKNKLALETIEKAVALLEIANDSIPVYTKKKKAGKARHANTEKLKEQFISYLESNESKNISEAARRFYKNRPNKSLKLPTEENDNIVRFFWRAQNLHYKTKQK